MKKLILTLIVALACVIPTAAAVFAPVNSIEALRDDKGFVHCTAFSINEAQHLWMTANHCVQDENGQWRENYINKDFALVKDNFPQIDVAIVVTDSESAPSLHLDKTAPAVGDTVTVTGYGWGLEPPTTFRGYVANPKVKVGVRFYQLFDMTVWPGHSGSPIFKGDKVISVAQIRTEAGASGGCAFDDLVKITARYWGK